MRIETADRLKALCIALMIVGHCSIAPGPHDFIYLFHIPLFFFVSGFFFKDGYAFARVKLDVRRLLAPYAVGVLLVLLRYAIDAFRTGSFELLPRYAASALVVGPGMHFAGYDNLDVGVLWFLPALFFCRLIFGLFSKVKHGMWIAAGIGLVACSLPGGIWLPLGLQQGIAGMFFYAAGHGFANARMLDGNRSALPVCALLAASAVWMPAIDMHVGLYPVPVLNAFASLGACVLLWKAVHCLEARRWKFLSVVSACGRISLVILTVHYFEAMTFAWSAKFAFVPLWAFPVVRLLIDVAVAALLCRVAPVRRFFCIK